jgi:hypothetical protein
MRRGVGSIRTADQPRDEKYAEAFFFFLDDDENKPVRITWAVNILSGVRDVEI